MNGKHLINENQQYEKQAKANGIKHISYARFRVHFTYVIKQVKAEILLQWMQISITELWTQWRWNWARKNWDEIHFRVSKCDGCFIARAWARKWHERIFSFVRARESYQFPNQTQNCIFAQKWIETFSWTMDKEHSAPLESHHVTNPTLKMDSFISKFKFWLK